MRDLLIGTIALILTVPLPFLIVFYFFSRKWNRKKQRAVHQTANVTTPIFILSVHVLLLVIFGQSFLPYIIILLLVLLSLSIIVQYKIHEEVSFKRAFKGFWRVSFLLFTIMYLGLSVYGLIDALWS